MSAELSLNGIARCTGGGQCAVCENAANERIGPLLRDEPQAIESPETAVKAHVEPLPRIPRFSCRTVMIFARKELRDSLRNRWFVLYTIAFAVLALSLALLSMAGTGVEGFAGFGRTAASLINLVILIVPLMALTAGATTLASERERRTLGYLLAQPVSRLELVLGKYLGLSAALGASLMLGFGLSAAIMATRGGVADITSFLWLIALSLTLALGMLSVGFLISAVVSRAGVGIAASIFLWLALVFAGDLGLMGSAIVLELRVEQLFHAALVNPMQVFKMASLNSIHASLDVLGPAGVYAAQEYGGRLPFIFAAVLGAWVILPLAAAQVIFMRRGGS